MPRRRWIRWSCIAVAGLVVAMVATVALVIALAPPVGDARRRAAAQQAADHAGPDLAHLPVRLTGAVLAVEDHRFYSHPGVDVLALGRFGVGLVQGRDDGGSTIELQLAKLLYTGERHDPAAVADRLGVALRLDLSYRKREIMLMYLDTAYFGHGFYGATAAAWGYFGRRPDDLDWAQAALLAGSLQAPDAYDPLLHPDAAVARRRHVLDRLRAVGTLTAAQAAAYGAAPLGLAGGGA